MAKVSFSSISQTLAPLFQHAIVHQYTKSTVLGQILAQDSGVAKRKTDDERWTDRQWLEWFLDNHSTEALIPLGVWKSSRYIRADYADREEISAMRAAYRLDGAEAAVAVLGAIMVDDLPPGTPVPELPTTWNETQRFRYQGYRDPGMRPVTYGHKVRDDK